LLKNKAKININKAKNSCKKSLKNNDFFFSFINVIETSGLFLYFRIRAIAKKKKKIHQFVFTKIYNPPPL